MMDTGIKGTTMKERTQSLLDTGLGSDCEFLVGTDDNKVLIKASKSFLIRASPVFERMFFGGLQTSYPVEVPDIEPEAFKIILQYCYDCDWIFKSTEQVVGVCYGANKYMLKELLKRCEEYLWPTDVDNLWMALQCSSLYCLENLKEASLRIVRIYAHEVLANPNFESINKASLIDILQQDYMNVSSELEVFEAVHRWAVAQCKEKGLPITGCNLQMEVKDAVGYIRFLSMSSAEFAEGPGESELLSTEDKLAILKTIVTHGKIPLPNHMCLAQLPRRECGDYF